ncbi:hypothetical protein [Desulfoscipio geothermicus]|uniref:Uncharacterized protein n=1 Tax=Desulfoscipio geothermicus DSM 3669 TaxID=1121426 RepID=A0A1I6DQQ5_9FIRM|nr:hypothetical protein [Desulfoscipio geothermicus]SFR07692.1 hypothetical protein SAMN05660706_1159 [Desulfoscipio geothermicus DSM 3669]
MTSEKKLAKLIDELLEEYMGTKYKRTDDNSLPATTAESPSINDNIEAKMNNRLSKNFFNNKYSDKYNAESAKQLPPGLVWVKNNEIHVQGLPGQNIFHPGT